MQAEAYDFCGLVEAMILDELERLAQTHSVQIMFEHRIGIEGQIFLQLLDALRGLLQSCQLGCWILLPKLAIRDDIQSFP